jgi:hypothetical protein
MSMEIPTFASGCMFGDEKALWKALVRPGMAIMCLACDSLEASA